MQISTVPNDFIINMATNVRGMFESSFLLHGLKIKNDGDEAITLTSINFELSAEGTPIKEVSYKGKALQNIIETCSKEILWLTRESYGAGLFLGQEGFWKDETFTKSLRMEPNGETGIFNEYFIVIYEKAMDELTIKVNYLKNGEENTESYIVPLIQYKNKNQYTFPVKGASSVGSTYNCLRDHRQHYSMEFAIDMVKLTEDHKLFYRDGSSLEDFPGYGEGILAIADGEVMDCYHSLTFTTSWKWVERKVHMEEYGFLPAQCGNYVILKHDNEEYSFYGHLATDSLTVKKGDRVKQGQVIGRMGTTGLSNCPHLHFQLMGGSDFLSARGLPCYFTNVRSAMGDKLEVINEDTLNVYAE